MSETNARSRKRFTVDALFSDTRPQAVGVRDLTDAKVIDLNRIHADPSQPRRTFDPDKLEELVESIKAEGILQPIAVRFDADSDRYVVIHGERRWRAARKAGLTSIPAIIRDVPQERRLIQQLMENVIRDDLNAVDRASALRALRSQMGDPAWDVVADTVGIKRSRLFQLLGTGKLSHQAQGDIQEGRLSEKQSRALQGLSPARQEALRDLIVAENMPAPNAMRLARAFRNIEIAPPETVEAARKTLAQVQAFVFARSDDQLQTQTRILLGAIRGAASGSDREQGQLKSLASTLAAPTFKPDRFSQELNALAKSLASVTSSGGDESAAIAAHLRDLRDTLDAILTGLPDD